MIQPAENTQTPTKRPPEHFTYKPAYSDGHIIRFSEKTIDKAFGVSLTKASSKVSVKNFREKLDSTPSAMLNKLMAETKRVQQEIADRELDYLLTKVVPPKRWLDEEGEKWVQKLSRRDADGEDAERAYRALAKQMKERKIRSTGIDYARYNLYDELFDELIRQVFVHSTTRGRLLLSVREEFFKTVENLRSMQRGMMSYAARKAIFADQELQATKLQEQQLTNSEKLRTKLLIRLKKELEEEEIALTEEKKLAEKKERDNYEFLKRNHQLLLGQMQAYKMKVEPSLVCA